MAGHSKWANIKHRKAAQDAKRGKIFTKIIRELTVAAKQGGGNVEDNPKLRAIVDKALAANMTRDTINRAIARGAGGEDDSNMEEVTYEGYGAGGIAVLVECLTDNRNRTVAEVRHAFSKHGGNLGTDGSVAYLFERKGQIFFEEGVDEEQLMDAALEAGAEDIVTNDDGSVEVLTEWTEFMAVKDALEAAGLTPAGGEVAMIASTQTELDLAGAEKIMKLIDRLEDLDDVQNVYTNADIPAEVMEQLG
ncbi:MULTISPECIES: YebC/PmpR family DNA-binding transcriptional regulator [Gammaproteobacteria]|uniref:YebC/PmpR family DNA-binding transcriptional regulator n=1 Tax=Gammaproteobacteria TaxID=1236 RepID=UPI001ADB4DB9|nr:MULTISPECIES: YebC/PmpR family DNA-binding transcriptional regulator [Gammaproteobacteria]MBO9482573.1 YebC/PmpR family DNA-binding transcriptional regulator [Salinisphaera sp. G21_0]MBO9495774.1 YebC/PmpR family DNA-binding transcriptional regulator [Thalassotalea sp. G20_0]